MESYLELLHLLEGFVHGHKPDIRKDANFSKIYKLSNIHSITGVVGYMSYQYPSLIPSPWKEKFEYDSAASVGIMSLKMEQLKTIEKIFESQGISYLLFKGAVIKDVYPVQELRTFGDIDLLIHPEDRDKVNSLFIKNGFVCTENWEPVYSYHKSKSIYEVHTELLDTQVAKCNIFFKDNTWECAVPLTKYRYTFTDEYHFVYLMTHLAKHVKGSGAGVRMILDLALMIEKRNLDFEWIESVLKITGLTSFSNYIFAFLSEYLNCDVPMDYEIPEDLSLFMEYIMEAGIFGKDGRDMGVAALKTSKSSKYSQIVRYIFPKAETISSRYTYLQKRPYLLPVAWVHRAVITASHTGHHISRAVSMAKADEKEVDRLKKMNESLGL
ncbi:MAG: nucleotidyltransferase family protein [Faecalicoccus sp.]|nr:nucleotidyltransferase family protein [Faecalicoccus sp.]